MPETKELSMNIGLDAEVRHSVCDILCKVLADQHVLYLKKRNFHWNLVGERFHTLHEFYEKQYSALESAIDETAERIRQLGGVSPGSMQEFLEASTLKEAAGELIRGEDSIEALVADHDMVIKGLREHIKVVADQGDAGTEDFLIALMQGHEEMAWMLRSFLR